VNADELAVLKSRADRCCEFLELFEGWDLTIGNRERLEINPGVCR